MKLFGLLIIAMLIVSHSPLTINAHPGGLDANGCHTCRTNCDEYGLFYGQYHCHDTISTPSAPTSPPSSSPSSTNLSTVIRGLIFIGSGIAAFVSYSLKHSTIDNNLNEISTDTLKKKNRNIHE